MLALSFAVGCAAAGGSTMSSSGSGAATLTSGTTGGAATGGTASTGGSTGDFGQYDTLAGTCATDGGLRATFSGALEEVTAPPEPVATWTATLVGAFAVAGGEAGEVQVVVSNPPRETASLDVVFPSVSGSPAAATFTCGDGGVRIAFYLFGDAGSTPGTGGTDGGLDGGADAGPDGGADGGVDAGLDAGFDAGPQLPPWLEAFTSEGPDAACAVTLEAPTLVQSAILSYYAAHGLLTATLPGTLRDGGADPGAPATLSATW